jgi:hypothetical protein
VRTLLVHGMTDITIHLTQVPTEFMWHHSSKGSSYTTKWVFPAPLSSVAVVNWFLPSYFVCTTVPVPYLVVE